VSAKARRIAYDASEPIRRIDARYQDLEIIFEGNNETMLKDFCKYVVVNDPDILVCSEQHYTCL
jgi:hypothetical protein